MDDQQQVTHTQTQFVFTLSLRHVCLSIVAALMAVGSLGWATESCTAVAEQSSEGCSAHYFLALYSTAA